MRIAVVTNSFPPHDTGGAAMIASRLAELWRESGHEVEVWTCRATWLRRNPFSRLFCHLFLDTRPNEPLIREIEAWQPTFVVSHNLTGCGLSTMKTLQKTGVPWIHVLHDVQLFHPSGQLAQEHSFSSWQRFWTKWRQPFFGQPDLVISPTQWLLDAHTRRGWFERRGTHVIPNVAPAFDPLPKPRQSSAKQLLFVGRVSSDKGSDTLHGLAMMQAEFHLRVIGDGPKMPSLCRQKNITCLGALPPEQVRQEMRQAAVLLVPSLICENQPTVILEALAVGLPVIANDVGGIRETLGPAGQVAVPWKTSWSELVLRLQDPGYYADMQEKIALWRERYAAPVVARAWNEVFLRLTSR